MALVVRHPLPPPTKNEIIFIVNKLNLRANRQAIGARNECNYEYFSTIYSFYLNY